MARNDDTSLSRESHSATSSGLSAAAEALLVSQLSRITEPTKYIAGFTTPAHRQLALQRARNGIYLWTEAVASMAPPELGRFMRRGYSASKSRSSNLNMTNASRLTVGHPVDYWQFDTLGDLQQFIDWYRV